MRKIRTDRICGQCGEIFYRPPSSRGPYCSLRCKGVAQSKNPRPLAERLWARVDSTAGPDACWPWKGAVLWNGYGCINSGPPEKRSLGTHRVAYSCHYGPIPAGSKILHSCDNPPCCNPAHLRLGTQLDNLKDMNAKGRNAKGERHGNVKLSDAAVSAIRLSHAAGATGRSLASAFSVSESYISSIIHGRARRN